mmetsp:Transcript_111/g.153  ORF Transcript_111/g.153 Transcript_111/m.153 type:complete len:353 (+) Transcript_111:53-1111(+)
MGVLCGCMLDWCKEWRKLGRANDVKHFAVRSVYRSADPSKVEKHIAFRARIIGTLRPGKKTTDNTTHRFLFWHALPCSFQWKTTRDPRAKTYKPPHWVVAQDKLQVSNVYCEPPPTGKEATWDNHKWVPVSEKRPYDQAFYPAPGPSQKRRATQQSGEQRAVSNSRARMQQQPKVPATTAAAATAANNNININNMNGINGMNGMHGMNSMNSMNRNNMQHQINNGVGMNNMQPQFNDLHSHGTYNIVQKQKELEDPNLGMGHPPAVQSEIEQLKLEVAHWKAIAEREKNLRLGMSTQIQAGLPNHQMRMHLGSLLEQQQNLFQQQSVNPNKGPKPQSNNTFPQQSFSQFHHQ